MTYETKPCPECGSNMVHETRTDSVTYKGNTMAYEQPAWWCGDCGEAVFRGEDSAVAGRAFCRLRAAVSGVLSPRQVATIREYLGLSQRKAGRILGGGPQAFHKYESGEVAPSRSICTALMLATRQPDLLENLPVPDQDYGDRVVRFMTTLADGNARFDKMVRDIVAENDARRLEKQGDPAKPFRKQTKSPA